MVHFLSPSNLVLLETLSNQSPKAALSLCEKYIKKKPDSTHLLAIRSYLLAQLGKEVDSEKIARALLSDNNITKDNLMVTTLSKVFSTLRDYETAASLLSDLFKAQSSVETGLELFENLLKATELRKAFPVALKLSSVTGNPSFLAWSLAVLLADHCYSISKDPSWANDSMLERVAEKVFHSTKDRASKIQIQNDETIRAQLESLQTEELRLLIQTYITLNDISSANDALEDLINLVERKRASPGDLVHIYRYLISVDKKEKARIKAEELLMQYGLYDWNLWKLLTDSLDCGTEGIEKCHRFLRDIEDISDKRSIILARLYLAEREGALDQMTSLIENYVTAFPTGSYHAFDLKVIFENTNEDMKSKIREFCSEKAKESTTSRVLWLTCADVLCKPEPCIQSDGFQDSLYDIIRIASRADRQSLKLAQDLLLKESGLPTDVTPYNFVIVQLILCLLLGTPHSFSNSMLLEIKMVQLDTVVYLISDHVFSFGLFDVAGALFDENFQMYSMAQKESFKKGHYSLAVEFLRFMMRIDNSVQSLSCVSGSIWSKVMRNSMTELSAALDPLIPDDIILNDNRDRNILTDIDATGRLYDLYCDHLPTFGPSQYYYRVVLSLILHCLLKPEIPVATINRFSSILERVELNSLERAICNLAQISHCSVNSSDDDVLKLKESILAVTKELDEFVVASPSFDLPYHIVEKCSKLFEYLRTVCLLVAAPFHMIPKSRKTALKAGIQAELDSLCSLADRVKASMQASAESESKSNEKSCQYIGILLSLIDTHCISIIRHS